MCGDCDPLVALDGLRRYFRLAREDVTHLVRGVPETAALAS